MSQPLPLVFAVQQICQIGKVLEYLACILKAKVMQLLSLLTAPASPPAPRPSTKRRSTRKRKARQSTPDLERAPLLRDAEDAEYLAAFKELQRERKTRPAPLDLRHTGKQQNLPTLATPPRSSARSITFASAIPPSLAHKLPYSTAQRSRRPSPPSPFPTATSFYTQLGSPTPATSICNPSPFSAIGDNPFADHHEVSGNYTDKHFHNASPSPISSPSGLQPGDPGFVSGFFAAKITPKNGYPYAKSDRLERLRLDGLPGIDTQVRGGEWNNRWYTRTQPQLNLDIDESPEVLDSVVEVVETGYQAENELTPTPRSCTPNGKLVVY